MVLIQALVTALLSGLFSGAILFGLNERRDRVILHLAKIELSIEAYANWVETLSDLPSAHFDLFISDRSEAAKADISQLKLKAREEGRKARLLLEIYLPDEVNCYYKVMSAYKDVVNLSADLQIAAINGGPLPEGAPEKISAAAIAVSNAGAKGRDRLYGAARRYSQAPFIIRKPQWKMPFRKDAA